MRLLRPQFTHQLWARLEAGTNIQLIGQHGQGRRRTLDDLQNMMPSHWRLHRLDCLRDLNANSGLMLFTVQHNVLIILHNADAWLANPKGMVILQQIAEFKGPLLCVTESGKAISSGLELMHLPGLSAQEVLAELGRIKLKYGQDSALLESVLADFTPYTALEALRLNAQ